MITPSNALSFLRGPLAFLFLFDSVPLRIFAIATAMFTDVVDGYLARKFKATSRLGAFLDAAMDKFFVFFLIAVFIIEQRLSPWQALTMVSRDLALIVFALYLSTQTRLTRYPFTPALSGKISTALQFLLLIALTLQAVVPTQFYYLFATLGGIVFLELFYRSIQKAT